MRYITPLVVAVLFASIASAKYSGYGKDDAYTHSETYDEGHSKPRPCPRIRADCGGCPEGEECKLNPGSAKECPSAKCVPKCKMCPAIFPECPTCAYGTECVRTSQTCNACATATCQPIEEKCKICPAVFPECPTCAYGTECVRTSQTCNACATATCQAVKNPPKPPTPSPPSTPNPGCVMCFIGDPPCPSCEYGQECVKYPATCKECAKSVCEPAKGPYY
ncbi:hypothetical protein BDF22DRAFT_774268 [Syncephalis plumigaleata]|nr:hypothetical protein BDF22DRAFT_774268 [Syncephalis plumigaleata]